MTRFVFIADTHLGANPMEFEQQPGYPEKLPELLALLDQWIQRDGRIDLVLHGGDLLDACSVELIREAVSLFDFGAPFYVCLGNHDLTEPDAVPKWLAHAPDFFISDSVHFEIVREGAVIHVLPSHWDEETYYWKDVQAPRLSAEQMEQASSVVADHPHLPHVLCTHSQVLGISPEQTGFEAPIHEPLPSFRDSVKKLVGACPRIRCILGGHNHTNTLGEFNGAVALSCSAFSCTPFEFKLVEITHETLSVTTHDLVADVSFDAGYDSGRAYVQGQPRDRQCRVRLREDD